MKISGIVDAGAPTDLAIPFLHTYGTVVPYDVQARDFRRRSPDGMSKTNWCLAFKNELNEELLLDCFRQPPCSRGALLRELWVYEHIRIWIETHNAHDFRKISSLKSYPKLDLCFDANSTNIYPRIEYIYPTMASA